MAKVIFTQVDGAVKEVEAPEGLSLMEVAHEGGIAGLPGDCQGSMACATCHVIVDPAWVEKLPEPTEEEEDMLDMVFGLTPTSRLSCQLMMNAALDGLKVSVAPSE